MPLTCIPLTRTRLLELAVVVSLCSSLLIFLFNLIIKHSLSVNIEIALLDLIVCETESKDAGKLGTMLHSWFKMLPEPSISAVRPSATQIVSLILLLFSFIVEADWETSLIQVWLHPESIIREEPGNDLLTSDCDVFYRFSSSAQQKLTWVRRSQTFLYILQSQY